MGDQMTVMVTGAGGQLGQELVRLQSPGVRFVGCDHSELDVTDAENCSRTVSEVKPAAVIHAAAYTAVDKAENEPEAAWRVNVEGARNMAAAAESVGAKFCYVSTDYVFDGCGADPYLEEDRPAPKTVYGRTKLEGEWAALSICSRTFVVRTSWVYGRYGSNFVNTMLQLAREKRQVTVVNDQTGSPTYTYDLAAFLTKLVKTEKYGVYHASNTGSCTWYEFAQTIFELSALQVKLEPCTSGQYERPAPRPAYSVLGHAAMEREGFARLRHWSMALAEYLGRQE